MNRKLIYFFIILPAEDDYFDSNSIARKASAKIISNAQCQLTNKAVTTDKICIVGDPSGSMCVVS